MSEEVSVTYGINTLPKTELEDLMVKMKPWDKLSFKRDGFTHEFVKFKAKDSITCKNVCGNSNMRDLTEQDRWNGRSHKCSVEDPCDNCVKATHSVGEGKR